MYLGDKILEVNGVALSRVTHAEAVEIFRRATKPKCHLLVQRLILPSRARSPSITNIYSFARPGMKFGKKNERFTSVDLFFLENTFEVLLNRGQNGLGLSLSGGSAENKPIEIIDIYPDQPAALSGRLKIGDVILSINDVIMHNRNVRVCHSFSSRQKQTNLWLFHRMCHQFWLTLHEMLSSLFVDQIHRNIKFIW